MIISNRQRLRALVFSCILLFFSWVTAVRAGDPSAPVPTFEKHILTDKYYCDGVTVGDINRDGHLDVIAGPFWYEGPDFKVAHRFYPPKVFELPPSPTDNMLTYVYDINGDGWPDILVMGRVHLNEAYWYENPGKEGLAQGVDWKKHYVFERIKGESPPFVDLLGTGQPGIVCHWENRWGVVSFDKSDPTKSWTFKPITAQGDYEQFYHGTGVGDVKGDGRLDLILNEGWFEPPPKSSTQTDWSFHPFKFGNKGGAQMFAYDVNGDGKPDIITSLDAHGWGLAWFEQTTENGAISFKKHMIMGDRSEEAKYGVCFSQPHALALADIDGDGLADIIVGKRMWAHGPKKDIEPMAAPVLYWFQLIREPGKEAYYKPHLIDDHSGVGVQICVADVNGDGRPDIMTASKLGVFVFMNKAPTTAGR